MCVMLLVGFYQSDDSPLKLPPFMRLLSLAGGLQAVCLEVDDKEKQMLAEDPTYGQSVWHVFTSQLESCTLLPLRARRRFPDAEAVRQFYRQHEATLTWFLEDLRFHHEWEVALDVTDRRAYWESPPELIATLWERCVAQAADVCPLPLRALQPGSMIWRGALLIPDQAAENWLRDAALMRQQAAEAGLTFYVVGPLPPFHFVPEL
jgi:hypothetical protein